MKFNATLASNIKDQAEIFCYCGSILQGITEEVKKKQAEKRVNSRFIMYVPWSSQISIEEYSKGSTIWKLCRITKSQASERLLGFRKKMKLQKNRGAQPPEDEKYQKRVREQGYSQSDKEEFDSMAHEGGLTSRLRTKGLIREACTRSYNPMQEEAATP